MRQITTQNRIFLLTNPGHIKENINGSFRIKTTSNLYFHSLRTCILEVYKQNNWMGWAKLTAWSHKRKFPPVQGCRSKGRNRGRSVV